MMQNLNIQQIIKNSKVHRPLIFNSVLWALAFIILLFIFSKGQTPITADYIYTVVYIVIIAIPVSINFYILIPKYLQKERYLVYSFLFLITLLVSAFLKSLFFNSILDLLFPSYFFISYLSEPNIYLTYGIILIATTLLKLAEDWFYFNKTQNRLLRLQNQQIQTQLSALRSQINPHFLFNSLNVIYAMALEKKENITNAIIELSDVLRYVIYDADTERVSLKDEIQLLNNYIAFQKHRTNHSEKVDLSFNVTDNTYQIYPMLLLPLLENAFKYGLSGSKDNKPIKIDVFQNDHKFEFTIKNQKENIDLKLDKNYSGVGLKTLQENLNLVYPNKHEFNITDTEDEFTVSIRIDND